MGATRSSYRYYSVRGGRPLQGEVAVGGAKNAGPQLLIASLLSSQVSVLENMPRTREVDITLSICSSIGVTWEWLDANTLQIDPSKLSEFRIPDADSRANRSSILFVAPLLARLDAAQIAAVGGDALGSRTVDFHVDGLRALGVDVRATESETTFTAAGLHGATVRFPFPSVGATQQLLIAAAAAEGRTVLRNAAVEPEIQNLVGFLQAMGARIQQEAGRTWTIDGVGGAGAAATGSQFRGVRYRIIPDRLQAASYATAAVVTGGEVMVYNALQEHMATFLNALRATGGEFEIEPQGIRFRSSGRLNKVLVETEPHPGFMTDWLPPLAVLLTQAEGVSIVHETVYESRFGYVPTLVAMGANIEMHDSCLGNRSCRFRDLGYQHSAVIQGPVQLQPSEMVVPDLRAGFAYLLAALIADGESRVWQIDYVERGYEALRENLLALGAEVSEGQALPPNALALASAFERGAEVRAGSALSPA